MTRTIEQVIASMLAARREGEIEAAFKLQRAGVITCARGHVTVLDRAKSEELRILPLPIQPQD